MAKIRRRLIIDLEVDRPFDSAAQERYVLASIEDAIAGEAWFDFLASKEGAPQVFSNARARFELS